jgi:hypothetical protein
MTKEQKIIRAKAGLLELAKHDRAPTQITLDLDATEPRTRDGTVLPCRPDHAKRSLRLFPSA